MARPRRRAGALTLAALAALAAAATTLQRERLAFLCGAPRPCRVASRVERRSTLRCRASAQGNVQAGNNLQSTTPRGQALQTQITVDFLKSHSQAGHALKELRARLHSLQFEATRLDGQIRVAYDGTQRLRQVSIGQGALQALNGSSAALSEAVLSALQEAHKASFAGTKEDVWRLYSENPVLMQAPLLELGAGSTAEDPWANVTKTEETLRLATELFERFDEDRNGFWDFKETSKVQLATEGTEMSEDAFTSLVIAAAPDGGRNLSEEDLAKGLSRSQVLELYTDAKRQRTLGFVLDISKDHATVFGTRHAADNAAASTDAFPSRASPAVD